MIAVPATGRDAVVTLRLALQAGQSLPPGAAVVARLDGHANTQVATNGQWPTVEVGLGAT